MNADKNQHITRFNWLKTIFSKLAILPVVFFIFSCSDQGCIDADDFGEYESQTVIVPANGAAENCSYDPALEITDSAQGSGIKICLTSGTIAIDDGNGTSITSTTGCTGFTNESIRNLCVSQCVQNCNQQGISSGGTTSQPNWTSTDKKIGGRNVGVTIRPGSEITIRAVGNITLGDSVSYPPIFAAANSAISNSYNSDWSNRIFDVAGGKTLNVDFSGEWSDGAGQVGSGNKVGIDKDTHNAARRTILHLIPHKTGYGFDTEQTSEEAGTIGVPLFANINAWTCSYSGSTPDDITQSSCSNKENPYTSLGYVGANDDLAKATYLVSSDFLTPGLGTYGGMIRFNGDGLFPYEDDPFNGILCNSADCIDSISTAVSSIDSNRGKLVGDNSTEDIEFKNNSPHAYKISFKTLATTGCTTNPIRVNIRTPEDIDLLDTDLSITLENGNYSTDLISVEPEQKLVIKQSSDQAFSSINCGELTAIKYGKYHDIEIGESGFVSFAMLNANGSCLISGRVINPDGSHEDLSSSYSADFYEYGTMNDSTGDPLQSITVNGTPLGSTEVALSNDVFLRKGQKLRLSPTSWNSQFSGDGLNRQCGIGMAMNILPRPALLCRGISDTYVNNPECIPETNDLGVLIGCEATSNTCFDDSSGSYCPVETCQRPIINCVDGEEKEYLKTNCDFGTRSPDCDITLIDEAKCAACDEDKKAAALQSAKQSIVGVDQCYDLENYKGKVSNIPEDHGFSEAQLLDNTISKGAALIGVFNGEYGNLANFRDTGKTKVGQIQIEYTN